MPDMTDQAQELEQFQRDEFLKQAWRRTVPNLEVLNCEECGERIPLKRRKALPGVKLCVECQQQLEKEAR